MKPLSSFSKLACFPKGMFFVAFVGLASLAGNFIPSLQGLPQGLLAFLFALAATMLGGASAAIFLTGFVGLLHLPSLFALHLFPEYTAFAALAGVMALLILWDLTRFRWVYGIAAVFIVLFLIPLMALNCYELTIRATMPTDSLLPLIETNLREASGFIEQNALLLLPLALAPLLGFWLLSFRKRFLEAPHPFASDTRILAAIILCLTLLGAGFSSRFITYGQGIMNFNTQAFAYQEGLKTRIANIPTLGMKSTRNAADAVTVIVVGESANRHHMSLYGYARPTTPSLDALAPENLLVFQNVIANSSGTHGSLTHALSLANISDNTKYYDPHTPSLFELLRSAGFYTAWLSNQKPHGLWGQSITDIAQNADTLYFSTKDERDPRKSRLLDSSTSLKSPFDEVLLPELDRVLATAKRPAVVFLHLMGSHIKASDRYPPAFHRFKSDRADIAAYDNSILYTDHLLGRVIAKLETISAPTSLLYVSDHSEDIDGGKIRDGSQFVPAQVEIPFVMWLSPRFVQRNPTFAKQARTGLKNAFMLDNLPHAVMDLVGVTGPFFKPNDSVFNKDFREKPRWTNDGQSLYGRALNDNTQKTDDFK